MDEVLVVQRGKKTDHPYKWEFPGGKVKEGETDEECIIREIREELSIDIVICGRLHEVEYDYGHKQITLIPYICDTLDDLPLLTEHNAFRWISRSDLVTIDFCEADISVAKEYTDYTTGEKEDEKNSVSVPELPVNVDEELRSMITGIVTGREFDWIINSAVETPGVFHELLEYSFSDDKRLAFRSSWILTKVCDNYPELLKPHLTRITEVIDNVDNESTERSFLKILSQSDLQKLSNRHHGILADHCFRALRSGFSAIAIKAYSMEILYNLTLLYPELANELSATINMLQEDGSAGIVSKGRTILRRLSNMSPGTKQIPG